ncbi:MAG TPA: CPXCG motif-containing cysteine-rich protein [Steroidobacteraceae bacterium]|nr:CPXCG motif-containing cysteine-rich protein [Steroidobacteraceae bacterium]
MKRRRQDSAIDERYGLEPVFEPGALSADGAEPGDSTIVVQVECPYCGEPFTTVLDLSAGSASYIEDCQVCCRPIEFSFVAGVDGDLESLELRRSD